MMEWPVIPLAPVRSIMMWIGRARQACAGRGVEFYPVNITSAMVKSPRPHMGLSTAARTGLIALSKAVALTLRRTT